MKSLNYKYVDIYRKINICIFVLLFIKTIKFNLNSKNINVDLSIVDIFNTHYITPIIYKVTMVLFLLFISLKIEIFYNRNVFLRQDSRKMWFKNIIKHNYILSLFFTLFIFISSLIIYFIFSHKIIQLNEFITITIKSGFNFVYFSIFAILYSILRIMINRPVIAIIVEVFSYLTIYNIMSNLNPVLENVISNLFFINKLTIYDIKNFIIGLMVLTILIPIGNYIATKKNL